MIPWRKEGDDLVADVFVSADKVVFLKIHQSVNGFVWLDIAGPEVQSLMCETFDAGKDMAEAYITTFDDIAW